MSYATRLKNMDKQYDDASDVDVLPLGKHEVEITRSEITETDWSQDLQWKLTFTGENGQRTEHINLERASTLWKVKQTAKKLGYEGELSGLPVWAPVAVGARVFVEVTESKSKDGEKTYINTSVVKLLSPGRGEPLKEAPAPIPASDLDEIPFAPSSMDNFL